MNCALRLLYAASQGPIHKRYCTNDLTVQTRRKHSHLKCLFLKRMYTNYNYSYSNYLLPPAAFSFVSVCRMTLLFFSNSWFFFCHCCVGALPHCDVLLLRLATITVAMITGKSGCDTLYKCAQLSEDANNFCMWLLALVLVNLTFFAMRLIVIKRGEFCAKCMHIA